MRWKATPKPKLGDTKTVKRFALFPRKVNNTWVWLEFYRGVYRYEKVLTCDELLMYYRCKWILLKRELV